MATFALVVLVACDGEEVPTVGDPLEQTGSCDTETVDLWRLPSRAAGTLLVEVDTLAAATTFDPDVAVYEVQAWAAAAAAVELGSLVAYSDDVFPCTFPPAQFACPRILRPVGAGPEERAVVVGRAGECASDQSAYRLRVELDGEPLAPVFVGRLDVSVVFD